jgi:hypothetical protein
MRNRRPSLSVNVSPSLQSRDGDDVLAEIVAGRAAEQIAEASHRTDVPKSGAVLLFRQVDA